MRRLSTTFSVVISSKRTKSPIPTDSSWVAIVQAFVRQWILVIINNKNKKTTRDTDAQQPQTSSHMKSRALAIVFLIRTQRLQWHDRPYSTWLGRGQLCECVIARGIEGEERWIPVCVYFFKSFNWCRAWRHASPAFIVNYVDNVHIFMLIKWYYDAALPWGQVF